MHVLLNQVEYDEAVGLTAFGLICLIIIVSLYVMWLSERKESQELRYQRDKLWSIANAK